MNHIPTEILGILGIGVIGFVGNTVLIQMGQKTMAVALDIILFVATAFVTLKFAWDGINKVARVFNISF